MSESVAHPPRPRPRPTSEVDWHKRFPTGGTEYRPRARATFNGGGTVSQHGGEEGDVNGGGENGTK